MKHVELKNIYPNIENRFSPNILLKLLGIGGNINCYLFKNSGNQYFINDKNNSCIL